MTSFYINAFLKAGKDNMYALLQYNDIQNLRLYKADKTIM